MDSRGDPTRATTLDVSVVVPVRDDAPHVGRCLESILAQRLDGLSMEVVVVDGGSIDGTRDIVVRAAERDHRIRVLDNPAGRVSPALNIGMRAARGRFLVRMDAHAEYDEDYIRESVRLLEDKGLDAVGGRQVPVPGADTATARAIAAVQETRFGLGGGRHRRAGYEGPAETLWLGTFRVEIVDRVGGFDEALFRSEDNEFYQRVRDAGGKLWISPSIGARYVCRPTLAAFARQCFTTGTEILPTMRRNPRAMSFRHLVPGATAVAAGLLAAVSFGTGPLPWAARTTLAAAAVVYVLVTVGSSMIVARRAGRDTLLPALVVFPTVHAAFALGTLKGLSGVPAALHRAPRPGTFERRREDE